jgi:arabinoxylan arabinofuranohydrolase
MGKWLCLWMVLSQVVFCHGQKPKGSTEKSSAYLFTYFTGDDESIRFALSTDGYNYQALNRNQPVLSSRQISSTGGVRDPHILRGVDGKTFYMVATDLHVNKDGWGPNQAMVFLKSNDLTHWTSQVVNIAERFPDFATVNRVWAPQTIYDPKEKKYMVYWSMRFGNEPDKIFYAYANKDFTGLETTPKQLFFSPTNNACIDGDIVLKDGKYNLFFKTEGAGNGIKKAVSEKLTEGYVLYDKYLDQSEEDVEGSGIFKLNGVDEWILMYDVYKRGKYQFTKTNDLVNFAVIDKEVTMNFRPRHGTVIPITASEAEALTSKWITHDEIIRSASSKQLKKLNTEIDTVNKKLNLFVKPSTTLTAFNPEFFNFPGAIITPNGNSDFTKGPVQFSVAIKGKGKQNYNVVATETHNPVLDGYYADPDILYAKKTGKFYLYPTSDGFTNWSGTYFKTFSSKDLVHWQDEGVILDLTKDVTWAKKNAWAPCIVEKEINGQYKYFYYFSASQKIGVAVADNPTGPFIDSGHALIDSNPEGVKGGQQIDPDVFTDPKTGKCYLYWGNGYLAGAELNDDMVSLKPGTTKILTPDTTYREGTHVFFRNGVYYFTWSENDTRDEDYRVRYGISTGPLDKIAIPENNMVIMKDKQKGIYGTGHHTTIKMPDQDKWYIVYHRFNYPNGINMGQSAGYHREVCIDKLEFSEDGRIRQVSPTHEGINP